MSTRSKPIMKQNDILSRLRRHPMLLLAAICIFAALMLDQSKKQIFSLPAALACCAVIIFLFLGTVWFYRPKDSTDWVQRIGVLLLSLSGVILLYYCMDTGDHPTMVLMVGGLIAIAIAAVFLRRWQGKLTQTQIVCLIMAVGFLLRLGYILYTNLYSRQHDVHFSQLEQDAVVNYAYLIGNHKSGHAVYIKYLMDNLSLPDFDPREVFQFYHPPLYHTVAAIWLKCCEWIGMSWERATEALQFFTLFCSMSCLWISYRIGQALQIHKTGLLIGTALVACHPTFFLLSGSVNNDILSVAFALGAILWTIRWYQSPSFRRILAIALCIGLGMMTKLSVAMVAPAIALVFLAKLIEERKKPGRTLAQYGAFAAVCFPLGLWWSIRNWVLFKMPVNYVPDLGGETNFQFIGDRSWQERLFGSQWEWDKVFERWGDPYYEFEPHVGLFKTALFDEKDFTSVFSEQLKIPCIVLFYLSLLLVALSIVALLWFLFRKENKQPIPIRMMIGGLYLLLLVSYYQFCFQYPYTCTMNARYVVPLIALGCLLIGDMIDKLLKQKNRLAYSAAYAVIFCSLFFCFVSADVYIMAAGA